MIINKSLIKLIDIKYSHRYILEGDAIIFSGNYNIRNTYIWQTRIIFREEDGQTVVNIEVGALGEDADATKEKIERAMEIFAANAKLGGVDVDSVTVNDPELGMLEKIMRENKK